MCFYTYEIFYCTSGNKKTLGRHHYHTRQHGVVKLTTSQYIANTDDRRTHPT